MLFESWLIAIKILLYEFLVSNVVFNPVLGTIHPTPTP